MDINIEYIKAQLQRRISERQLRKVADGSGVGLRTVHRIAHGAGYTIKTAEKLQGYLERNEKKKKLDDGPAEPETT